MLDVTSREIYVLKPNEFTVIALILKQFSLFHLTTFCFMPGHVRIVVGENLGHRGKSARTEYLKTALSDLIPQQGFQRWIKNLCFV